MILRDLCPHLLSSKDTSRRYSSEISSSSLQQREEECLVLSDQYPILPSPRIVKNTCSGDQVCPAPLVCSMDLGVFIAGNVWRQRSGAQFGLGWVRSCYWNATQLSYACWFCRIAAGTICIN